MAANDRDVLPNSIKPIHYDIQLFDLELGGTFSFHGRVSIDLDVKTTIHEITLNAHQLEISSAAIDGKNVQGLSGHIHVVPVY